MSRPVDALIALLLAALLTAVTLWPAGPRPEDLRLEVVSVRKLPPEEGYPPRVEVQVRWSWLRRSAAAGPRGVVAVSADLGRWMVTSPDRGVRVNSDLLALLQRPPAFMSVVAAPGTDGEQTFVLSGRGPGREYDGTAITLHVQYIHEASVRLGWPGRSWVRTVSGTYPLGEGGSGH